MKRFEHRTPDPSRDPESRSDDAHGVPLPEGQEAVDSTVENPLPPDQGTVRNDALNPESPHEA